MAILDILVIAAVCIVALVCLGLGLVRVVLGLAGWVGAGLVTIYAFRPAQGIAQQWIASRILADIAAGATLFLVSLVALTYISHAIARRVKRSPFGVLDRTLGLVAGLGLGALLVSAAFLVYARVTVLPPERGAWPQWIRAAKTTPAMVWGAKRIAGWLPREWGGRGVGDGRRPGFDPQATMERLLTPEAEPGAPAPKSGYNDQERREMDRLIRSQQ